VEKNGREYRWKRVFVVLERSEQLKKAWGSESRCDFCRRRGGEKRALN